MWVFGLTGGISSGKSTVAAMFATLGAGVIDADLVSREAVEPGEAAFERIVARFGPQAIDKDGTLNRTWLRGVVFADADARRDLEAIVHPEVQRLTAEKLARLEEEKRPIAIYEAALLVETGLYETFNGLVVVTVEENEQLRRLTARDRISEEQAREIVASQMKTEEKTRVADWVIDNSGTPDQARRQVETLWKQWEKEGKTLPS